MKTPEQKTIERFVREGRAAPSGRPAMLKKWGWTWGLNRAPPLGWMFSAKLYPPGRGSDSKDWERLGRVVALVSEATGYCGPEPEPLTPFETTPPGATHYWVWQESVPAPEKS